MIISLQSFDFHPAINFTKSKTLNLKLNVDGSIKEALKPNKKNTGTSQMEGYRNMKECVWTKFFPHRGNRRDGCDSAA